MRDPVRSRRLLAALLAAVFALSACRDLALLAGAGLLAALLLRRGAWGCLRRTLRSVVPVTAGLSLASLGWLRLVEGAWPPVAPFAALALRAAIMGFLTFSVLERVDLLPALAPYPLASRLLSVTLAQIHALRLLLTGSLQGLQSRLVRRPRVLDVVRGAGGITGALFTHSTRNAQEIHEAMRARGFW